MEQETSIRRVINGELGTMVARLVATIGVPAIIGLTGWLLALIFDGHDRLIQIGGTVKEIHATVKDHETRIRKLEDDRNDGR